MNEAMKNAESIFASMNDWQVANFIAEKSAARIAILRDKYAMDYGAGFLGEVASWLTDICKRYAADNAL